MQLVKDIRWWGRWLVRYAPVQYYRRLRGCEHLNTYEWIVCLDCGKELVKK